MRSLFLPALFLLAACSTPDGPVTAQDAPSGDDVHPEADTHGFDGEAWLAEATRLNAPLDSLDYDDEARTGRMKELAALLAEEADWRRVCDTEIDYETGEAIYTPIPDGEGHWVRGTLDLPEGPNPEGLVAVTCDFGAYQGSYALVQIDSDRASLVESPVLGEDYQPTERTTARYGTLWFDDQPEGTFATHIRYRGPGDCGEWTRYRLSDFGTAEIETVRVQDCEYDTEPNIEAWTWPVVYAR